MMVIKCVENVQGGNPLASTNGNSTLSSILIIMELVMKEMQMVPKFLRFWFLHVNDVEKFEDAFFNGIVQEILEHDGLSHGKGIIQLPNGNVDIHNLIGDFDRYKKTFIVRIFYLRPTLVFAYMKNNDEFMMDALMGGLLDHGISIERHEFNLRKIAPDSTMCSLTINGQFFKKGEDGLLDFNMDDNTIIDVKWVQVRKKLQSLERKTNVRIWERGWIDVEMVPGDIVFRDRNKYLYLPIELLMRIATKLEDS